jgi:hypothetical protein
LILGLLIGLIFFGGLGVLLGLFLGYRFTAEELEKARAVEHIDYKDRWSRAIALLQEEGKLTDEQLKQISAVRRGPKGSPPRGKPSPVESGTNHGRFSDYQKLLLAMPPDERRKEESSRLAYGRRPVDPLTGLPPETARRMLNTRRMYGYHMD